MIRTISTANIVRFLAIGPNNTQAEFDTSIQALEWLEQHPGTGSAR